MPKYVKPFITRMQAEGTAVEKRQEREELRKRVQALVSSMPDDLARRTMYVRELASKALRGELDEEVFKEFVKVAHCASELETILPRVKLVANRKRRQ